VSRRPRGTKLVEAKRWLRAELRKRPGGTPRRELIRLGAEAGFSKGTLTQAAHDLGFSSRSSAGVWRLPNDTVKPLAPWKGKYPPEMRARAKSLHANGLAHSEIARQIGVGTTTVGRWLGPRLTAKERAQRRLANLRRSSVTRRGYEVAPADGVVCLECGEVFHNLGLHLKRHGLDAQSYRAKHGADAPLVGEHFRTVARALITDLRGDIPCLICGKSFISLVGHLRVHGLNKEQYEAKYEAPVHPVDAPGGGQSRGIAKVWEARREATTCPYGHRLTPKNTFTNADGGRVCRTCQREAGRRFRKANRKRLNKERRHGDRARYASDPEYRARRLEDHRRYRERNRGRINAKRRARKKAEREAQAKRRKT
jgi:predicted transcriptional regulator